MTLAESGKPLRPRLLDRGRHAIRAAVLVSSIIGCPAPQLPVVAAPPPQPRAETSWRDLPALARRLNDPNSRYDTLRGLGIALEKGEDISAAVPAIARFVSESGLRMQCDADEIIKWHFVSDVMETLKAAAEKGADMTAAVPMVAKTLSDASARDYKVLRSLTSQCFGGNLETLNDLIEYSATSILEHAAEKGIDISMAFPSLIKLLPDKGSFHVLFTAAEAGSDLSAAVPKAAVLIMHGEIKVKNLAGDLLGVIASYEKGGQAMNTLVWRLGDEDSQVRAHAAFALTIPVLHNVDISPAVPALLRMLPHNPNARTQRPWDTPDLNIDTTLPIPPLSDSYTEQFAACWTLGTLAAKKPDTLHTLLKLLVNKEPSTRLAAIRAIEHAAYVNGDISAARPYLPKLLVDTDIIVQRAAKDLSTILKE